MSSHECRDVRESHATVRRPGRRRRRLIPSATGGDLRAHRPQRSGKTTLLNCIEGLDTPTSGTISVPDRHPIDDQHELTLRTGVQLQSAELLPRITVAEAMQLFSSFYEEPEIGRASCRGRV